MLFLCNISLATLSYVSPSSRITRKSSFNNLIISALFEYLLNLKINFSFLTTLYFFLIKLYQPT